MSKQVAVGRFGSPYGVKGWIKVISYTDPIEQILDYLPWHITKNNVSQLIEKVSSALHGNSIVVLLPHCLDREAARTFTNLEIFIDHEQLPELEQGEFYWVDLIGLSVITQEQQHLGVIEKIFSTGSNDVLVVTDESGQQHYVPYLDEVIKKVDLNAKMLLVDWEPSF